MFCNSCGNEIVGDTKFCSVCGTPVAAPMPAAPVPGATPMPAAPMPGAAPMPAAPVPGVAPVNSEQGMNFDFTTNTVTSGPKARYQYKVLSQKDKWFSGKFDPMLLEQAMNAYAQQGWRVIGCATADIVGFGGPRQEFVTLLEREV